MGASVAREEASVYNPGTEQFEIFARWTTAPGDGGCRFSADFQDLAALGRFQ